MKSNIKNRHALRLTITSAFLAASFLSVSPAGAQTQLADNRWQAYTGCWEPVDAPATVGARTSSGSMVCVVPGAGRSVQIASIANRKVVHVEQVNATGERVAKTVDGCTGWESAAWSKDGRRLFMRSNFGCTDSVQVKGSTVFSITPEGNWVHVQGNTVGKAADSRITVFKLSDEVLAPDMVLADSAIIRTVVIDRSFSERMIRLAAAEPASVDAILEISKNSDPQVAQTWVAQFGQPARLSAKELVALADAGMPPDLIDMMVAKAYPERFVLQANNAVSATDGRRPTNADIARANGVGNDCSRYNRLMGYRGYYNSLSDCPLGYGISPYGYGIGRYGYGFGYPGYGLGNYYYGSQPIIIIQRGADDSAPQSRAVRGQGYTREKSTTSSAPRTSSGSSGSSSSGSSSSGSSSAGSSSSGGSSSGGSSSGRTAIPKPPPSN